VKYFGPEDTKKDSYKDDRPGIVLGMDGNFFPYGWVQFFFLFGIVKPGSSGNSKDAPARQGTV